MKSNTAMRAAFRVSKAVRSKSSHSRVAEKLWADGVVVAIADGAHRAFGTGTPTGPGEVVAGVLLGQERVRRGAARRARVGPVRQHDPRADLTRRGCGGAAPQRADEMREGRQCCGLVLNMLWSCNCRAAFPAG